MLFIAWIYRQIFNCCRRVDKFLFAPDKKDEHQVPITSLPWLWIGAKHEDGTVVDHTTDVNNGVEYGLNINPLWLELSTGTKNVQWRYLDTKTLEVQDFPSSGFVINDPNPDHSEESSDN